MLSALKNVSRGLQIAAELGANHRFLVYNGSVHAYNISRPLLAQVGGASDLATVFDTVLKALTAAEEPDMGWRLRLSMELARCMERAGRKKEAVPILASCTQLAEKTTPALQVMPPRDVLVVCASC